MIDEMIWKIEPLRIKNRDLSAVLQSSANPQGLPACLITVLENRAVLGHVRLTPSILTVVEAMKRKPDVSQRDLNQAALDQFIKENLIEQVLALVDPSQIIDLPLLSL